MAPAKVAFRPVGGFMTPRQLGPTILILPRLASSRTWRSSSAPSDPVSLKPAEMIRPRPPPPRTRGSPHRRCGGDDDREIHPGRHLGDRRVCLYAEYVGPVRVHGEDRPAERAAHEIPHDRAPHATRTLGRPDHSHRLGTEDGIQLLPFVTQNIVGRVRALGPLHSRSPSVAPASQQVSTFRLTPSLVSISAFVTPGVRLGREPAYGRS